MSVSNSKWKGWVESSNLKHFKKPAKHGLLKTSPFTGDLTGPVTQKTSLLIHWMSLGPSGVPEKASKTLEKKR